MARSLFPWGARWIAGLLLAAAPAWALASTWTVTPALRRQPFVDSTGEALRLNSLKAPLVVMTMSYTACKKVCATTTLVLGELQRRLDTLGVEADFVVVSYDPAKDSPREWREYRERRGLHRPNWHFLSGDLEATRRLARDLDLNFWSYDDHVMHDFRIVLFDAQWHWIGELDWAQASHLETFFQGLPQTLARISAAP
jgi:protein SCO1